MVHQAIRMNNPVPWQEALPLGQTGERGPAQGGGHPDGMDGDAQGHQDPGNQQFGQHRIGGSGHHRVEGNDRAGFRTVAKAGDRGSVTPRHDVVGRFPGGRHPAVPRAVAAGGRQLEVERFPVS